MADDYIEYVKEKSSRWMSIARAAIANSLSPQPTTHGQRTAATASDIYVPPQVNDDIKINETESPIVDQLIQFGYEKSAIMQAIQVVSDKNDINQIVDQIESQKEKQSNALIINKQSMNDNQILCLYASDISMDKSAADSKCLYLRHSPFIAAPTHNKYSQTMHILLEYDETNNIYYLPIGMDGDNLHFNTSDLTWPDQYTILMWVRWKTAGTITTFDSEYYSPIYAGGGRLGCASGYVGWKTIDNYRLEYGKWQCVVVFGGNNKSAFFVGDLVNPPVYVGSVDCDICGQKTYRIGNANQGPGDIGSIIVFDAHKSKELITKLYHESISIMGTSKPTNIKPHQQPEMESKDEMSEIEHYFVLNKRYNAYKTEFLETPLDYATDFKFYANDGAAEKIEFEVIDRFLERKRTEEREERYKIVQEWSRRKKMQQLNEETDTKMNYDFINGANINSPQYAYEKTDEGYAIKTGEINMGLRGKMEIYENVSYDQKSKKFYFDPNMKGHPMHIITRIQNHLSITAEYLIAIYAENTQPFHSLSKGERKRFVFEAITQWSNELRAFFYKIRERITIDDETVQKMEFVYDLWLQKFGGGLPKYLNDDQMIANERSKDPLNILLKVCHYAIKALMKPGITEEEWLRCRLCLAAFSSIVAFNFGMWEYGDGKQEIFHKGIVKDLAGWAENQLFVVKTFMDEEIGMDEIKQFERIHDEIIIKQQDLLARDYNNSQPYPQWFIVGEIKEEQITTFALMLMEYMSIVGLSLDQMENIIRNRYLYFRSKANTCNAVYAHDMKRIFGEKKFVHAPVKSNERVMVKMSEDYNNNSAKILDWVRGIVKCDDVRDLIKQFKKMKYEFETNKDQYCWKILRVKNGFDMKTVDKTVWYSLSVNIEWSPPLLPTKSETMRTISLNHICEVQFTLKTLYDHKQLMHRLYKIQRVEDADNYKYIE